MVPLFQDLVLLFLCLVPEVLVVVSKFDHRVPCLVHEYIGLVLAFLVPKFCPCVSKFDSRGLRFGPCAVQSVIFFWMM